MKTLLVASEAFPFAKTGGLGDVMHALPAALAKKRVSTRVILPLYGSISEEWRTKMTFLSSRTIRLAWRDAYCGLFELKYNGVCWYFIDNEYYFKRSELYGQFDDGERFAFFSRAAAELALELPGWKPDVVHCHDWQTALVPVYLRTLFAEKSADIRTVFTIHNIEYQGRYSADLLSDVFSLPMDLFYWGTIEFAGGLNLMKAAIEMSDAVTTVSPTYARELSYAFYARGLEGVIGANAHKLRGILNGIDMELYNPAADQNLFEPYSSDSLERKKENKRQLQKLLGLAPQPDVPLIVMISRLVPHKGLDLVAAALNGIMDMDVQMAVLGRGDWHFEQLFIGADTNYQGRLSATISYNEAMAMKLYAGGDIFLMPSQSEPCGLSQMIAMRYGAVPVVRETGGLRDTVTPYLAESDEGLGFTFANYNADDMLYVLRSAAELYRSDPKAWKNLMRRGMESDFSWTVPAKQYLDLYKEITGKR